MTAVTVIFEPHSPSPIPSPVAVLVETTDESGIALIAARAAARLRHCPTSVAVRGRGAGWKCKLRERSQCPRLPIVSEDESEGGDLEVAESDDEPGVYDDEKCASAAVAKARGLGLRVSPC